MSDLERFAKILEAEADEMATYARSLVRANKAAVVGQAVNVRLDSGETKTTKTRGGAELLGGHTAVVWLEGIAGAYALDRVTILKRAVEAADSQK
jgi:hypothetical protein